MKREIADLERIDGNKPLPDKHSTSVGRESHEPARLSLRVNFGWTFVGNVVYAASQWGMLSMLAKLGTPDMVGQFALGLAVTAPIIIFSKLNLRAVQATDANQLYEFSDYFGLRLATVLVALLAILVMPAALGYEGRTATVIIAVGFAKSIEAISDIFYGYMQRQERMANIARSLILKGPFSFLGMTIGVYVTNSVLGGVLGLTVAWVIVLVFYDISVTTTLLRGEYLRSSGSDQTERSFRPRWEVNTIVKLVRLALPLGFTSMLISLNSTLPRYFLERHWGEYDLGIFAALAYLMTAGTTVVNALGQSAMPRLAKYYARNKPKAFRVLLTKLIGIGILVGTAGFLLASIAGRPILELLYRPEYSEYTDVLLWLVLAATVNYVASFLGYGMTAARYFRVQPMIFGAASLVSLGSCYVFIPRWGLLGAAWAVLATAVFQGLTTLFIDVKATWRLEVTAK